MANHSRSLVRHRKHRVASARPGLGSHPISFFDARSAVPCNFWKWGSSFGNQLAPGIAFRLIADIQGSTDRMAQENQRVGRAISFKEGSMWMRSSLLVLAGTLAWACQRPQQQPLVDVTAEIRAADDQFSAAFGAHDAQALASLYTADAKLLPPNSDFVSGRAAIQTFWRGVMDAGVAGAALTIEEAVGTDSLAVEVGRYVLSDSAGSPIDAGKYMVWWKRGPDGWRLHRDIWNSSRPSP